MSDPIHASGMPQSRWDSPFKTPEERKLVVAYFKKYYKQEKEKALNNLEKAPY
jgi:hypothetical protein